MTSKQTLLLIGLLLTASLISMTTVIAQQRRKPRPATPPSVPPVAQSKPQDKHSVGDRICIDVWAEGGEVCGIIEEIASERYKVQITTVTGGKCTELLVFTSECEGLRANACSGDRTIRVRGYKQQGEAGAGDYVWIPKYCDGYGAVLRRKSEEARAFEEERSRIETERRRTEARAEAEKRRSNVETRMKELEAVLAPANSLLKNSYGLEMILIEPGEFLMGHDGRVQDDQPQHKVAIKQPFYVGKYEVTQAQWSKVMGYNPSQFKGDNLPVDSVSFNDAREFCKKLVHITGQEYRLPTEAEWEYVCRAGTISDYAFDLGYVDYYAWYVENSGGKTQPVGQKSKNKWGIYDMHGNVREWCEDVYHNDYQGAPHDGSAWLNSGFLDYRVLRGGAWKLNSSYCRSAYRDMRRSDVRSNDIGFRVVVSARTQSP